MRQEWGLAGHDGPSYKQVPSSRRVRLVLRTRRAWCSVGTRALAVLVAATRTGATRTSCEAGNTGQVIIQGGTFYGTLVVEGNGPGSCSGQNLDMMLGNFGSMQTATHNSAVRVYGYPLTLLIYDPQQQPPPTAANPYAPQKTCADIGSGSGTEIRGFIYSGGRVESKTIDVRGGIVAFDIQTQAAARPRTDMTTNTARKPRRPVSQTTPAISAILWSRSGSRSSSALTTPRILGAALPAVRSFLAIWAPVA